MKTSSVRIDQNTKSIIKALSEEQNICMIEIVREAVECYRRKIVFQQAENAYENIMSNPEEREEYLNEIEKMNGTLADGLEVEDLEGWI